MAGVHHTEPLLHAFSLYKHRGGLQRTKGKHWMALKPIKAEPIRVPPPRFHECLLTLPGHVGMALGMYSARPEVDKGLASVSDAKSKQVQK